MEWKGKKDLKVYEDLFENFLKIETEKYYRSKAV